ncbi:hypothetical protein FV222_16585, partial [Methylobacterium sp. WL103]
FVLANTMLVQLSMPLNFMGMIYREIKQALIDIDDMFRILHRNSAVMALHPPSTPCPAAGTFETRFREKPSTVPPILPYMSGRPSRRADAPTNSRRDQQFGTDFAPARGRSADQRPGPAAHDDDP